MYDLHMCETNKSWVISGNLVAGSKSGPVARGGGTFKHSDAQVSDYRR